MTKYHITLIFIKKKSKLSLILLYTLNLFENQFSFYSKLSKLSEQLIERIYLTIVKKFLYKFCKLWIFYSSKITNFQFTNEADGILLI